MTEKKKLVRKGRTVAPPPVKIVIPKPSELPAAKAVVVPPKPEMTMGMAMEDPAELRSLAQQVGVIWDDAPDQLKPVLRPALWHVLERIQRRGLLQLGYASTKGDYLDMLDAESWYLYKKPLDKTARCSKITLSGHRCKNRPMLGMEHCGVTRHATSLEHEQRRANHGHWLQYFQTGLGSIGLLQMYRELQTRSSWKENKNG